MKTKGFPTQRLILIGVVTMVIVTGCSKDENEEIITGKVNQYLLSLPAWEQFSPPEDNCNIEFEPEVEFSCEDKLVTTTTPCSFTNERLSPYL